LNITRHTYSQDQRNPGRETLTEVMDASRTVQSKTEMDFADINHTTNPSTYPDGVRFSYPSEVRQYELEGGTLRLTTTTDSTYDPTWGDPTLQQVYKGDGTLFTSTAYTYLTNVTDLAVYPIPYPTTFLHSIPRSVITTDTNGNVIS